MEEEVVIVLGRKSLNKDGEPEERVIKVKLNGDGSLSDLLRKAADVIDGTP